MASDERCPKCDRVNAFQGETWRRVREASKAFVPARAELRRIGDPSHCYGMEDCIAIDWRARALAAEAQRDSLASALGQVKVAADFDRISFGAIRERIAELEATVERMLPVVEGACKLLDLARKNPPRDYIGCAVDSRDVESYLDDEVDAYRAALLQSANLGRVD